MSGFKPAYPGYDVLAKQDTPSWDALTREVVRKRLEEVPARRFLNVLQWDTLEAICRRLIPQPDRPHDPVPITPWIDQRLDHAQGDGYRMEDMPPLRECWQRGLDAIEQESWTRHAASFTSLDEARQDALLKAVQEGDVAGPGWGSLRASSFFGDVLLRAVVEEYYAHPAGWSEVGFGGPASPRGYVRLARNLRDPWEGGDD
jgi:hypothetical protein